MEGVITWIFDEGTFKPAAKLEHGSTLSIITDYLGTPVEVYDGEGKQSWRVEYDIYGKIRKQHVGKPADCPFRYQGQYEDEETDLYYNRFRFYAADEGMYISKDPIGTASGRLNLYSYVENTSAYIDPFGLAKEQQRDSLGKFMPKNGGESVPGSDAVAQTVQKYQADPNYRVKGTEISFKDQSTGQIRRYDVVVEEVSAGKTIGVEVKSNSATKNKAQRKFDAKVDAGSTNILPTGTKAKDANITKIDGTILEKVKCP